MQIFAQEWNLYGRVVFPLYSLLLNFFLLKTIRNDIVATKQFFKNNNYFESIIDERNDLSSMKFQIYYLNSRIKKKQIFL